MVQHLIKLCVGADSVRDLEEWIEERLAEKIRRGERAEHAHVTRMVPKRREELLDGGSLYWVIKGQVAARQRLLDLVAFTDGEGIARCRLVLDPQVTKVRPRPCRPFQGWRYLAAKDAPADLAHRGDSADMPEAMRLELHALGLL